MFDASHAKATFVTGISAGSVGTYIWAPWIISMYDEANVQARGADAKQIQHVQMGDSYVPLFGVPSLKDGAANWGQQENYLKVTLLLTTIVGAMSMTRVSMNTVVLTV